MVMDDLCVGHWYRVIDVPAPDTLRLAGLYDTEALAMPQPSASYLLVEGARVDEMLAVVEYEQHVQTVQNAFNRRQLRRVWIVANAQRCRDTLGYQSSFAQIGQLDQPNAVNVRLLSRSGEVARDAKCQAGLTVPPVPASVTSGERSMSCTTAPMSASRPMKPDSSRGRLCGHE